jgi:protein-S-isoprenylcysteine O-methyltransferase Ste14
MSWIPTLGPRGEGWVVLQLLLLAVVGAACLLAPGTAGLPDGSGTAAVGLVLLLLGGVVFLSGARVLRGGDSLTALPHPTSNASLVITGPYAYVRHPIYAGLLAGSLGISILQDSGPALVATIALAVVLDLKRRREEVWLASRFADYDAYRARTKALIPFVY